MEGGPCAAAGDGMVTDGAYEIPWLALLLIVLLHAGHYVPAVASHIFKTDNNIPLKGLAVGNGELRQSAVTARAQSTSCAVS